MWTSALQTFSHNRSFISSQDFFEVMAFVTSVCIKALDFTFASLALLSLVRSAAVSMSVRQIFQLGRIMFIKNRYIHAVRSL